MRFNSDYEEVVAEAASWLDENWNVDEMGMTWTEAVPDLRDLEMSDACWCVAGQLGASIARARGIPVSFDNEIIECENGFDVLLGNYSAEYVNEEAGLRELHDYVEKVLGTGSIPPNLSSAFTGSTPRSLWLREIRRREPDR